jgi:hypothetical protein
MVYIPKLFIIIQAVPHQECFMYRVFCTYVVIALQFPSFNANQNFIYIVKLNKYGVASL